jgi:putrescine transport system substrate-binding protein
MSHLRILGSAAALALTLFSGPAGFAQGIIPGQPQPEELAGTPLSNLTAASPEQLASVQRMLMRLGYLPEGSVNRVLDNATVAAISTHLSAENWQGPAPSVSQLRRSLFDAMWRKDGWADGTAWARATVVEKENVRLAQQALKDLIGEPSLTDGIFGPASFNAVLTYQSANSLKETGVLNREMFSNIMRSHAALAKPPQTTLRILSAEGMVDPAALTGFELATGMHVLQDTYTHGSETKALLMEGTKTYDLIIQPGAQMRQVLEKPGVVLKIDRKKIPNTLVLDTASQSYTEALDPLNAHTIPYQWGTVGLAVNRDKVALAAPDAPQNSMALLLEPRFAAPLSTCGIAVVDEPIDVIPSIVSYVGGDFNNVGITDLEAVDSTLEQVKGFLQVVPKAEFVSGLASGRFCAGIGFSGDVLTARDKARVLSTGEISYRVPKEGSELWFQLFVVPEKAPNVEAAYRLIDHFLIPEVAAAGTKALNYANTVWKAGPLLEPTVLHEPGIFPPREVMSRLSIQPPLSADVEAELNRIWAKLKRPDQQQANAN